jgi:Insect cuticle protein
VFIRYELSDGQIRSEEGRYKDGVDAEGNPVKILVVQGAFSWVAPGKLKFSIIFAQILIYLNNSQMVRLTGLTIKLMKVVTDQRQERESVALSLVKTPASILIS